MARNFATNFFLAELIAWRIWKGDFLKANLFGKVGCIKYLSSKNQRERVRQKDDEFIVPVADGAANLIRRDSASRETTLRREPPIRSERFQWRTSKRRESQPTETTDDFWSIQGDFIYRHHNEPLRAEGRNILCYTAKQ